MSILCKIGFHKPMQHVWVVLDDGQLYKKCSRCGKVLGQDKSKLKKISKGWRIMADYIEREKVTELIDYHQEEYFEAESYFGLLKEDFLKLPSADVALVVHGKWGDSIAKYGILRHKCSVCNKYSHMAYNYCPNCGARMDGEI